MGKSNFSGVCRECLVRRDELLVGQDIYWRLADVDGHDRHQWIVDDFELGRRIAEQLSFEKHLGGPARLLEYNQKLKGWLLEAGYG